MEINKPEIVAEVAAAFAAYEKALVTNDVAVLDRLFWDSPHTIRYGGGENLYGSAEIAAFLASRPSVGLMREQLRPQITTFGDDYAGANTMFTRETAPGKIGRQSQTWVRTEEGWRVVAAHVSVIPDPDL